jgi:hypothetical protein
VASARKSKPHNANTCAACAGTLLLKNLDNPNSSSDRINTTADTPANVASARHHRRSSK